MKTKCEICKKMRSFEDLETHTERMYFRDSLMAIDRNVAYCRDNPKCKLGAAKEGKKFAKALGDKIIPIDFCPAGFADIVEGPNTYKAIAAQLNANGSCLAGWNDQDFTHLDVLFTLRPRHFGNIQGGIRPETYLFVSVMRVGAFAFNLNRIEPLRPEYIEEKLGDLGSPTKERLTDLINGVMKNL